MSRITHHGTEQRNISLAKKKQTAQQRAAQQKAARRKASQRKPAKEVGVLDESLLNLDANGVSRINTMTVRQLEKIISLFDDTQLERMWDSQALPYLMVPLPTQDAPAILPEEGMSIMLEGSRKQEREPLRVMRAMTNALADVIASTWSRGTITNNVSFRATIYTQLLNIFARAGLADMTPVSEDVLPAEPIISADSEKTYPDYSADLTPGAEGYSFVADFREEMVRVVREFRKQFIDIEQILSYRYKADFYLDWLISYRLTNVDQRVFDTTPLEQQWVRIPAEYSKDMNSILKEGLIAPGYFMAVPVARWNIEDETTNDLARPYVHFPHNVPVGFHPLASWDVQQSGIREELESIYGNFSGSNGRFEKVGTDGLVFEVLHRTDEGLTETYTEREDQPWLFQYLRDNPQHAGYITNVLNNEADDMDADLPFEWQIQTVDFPKPVGEYTPVDVAATAR